ncbi:phosphoribosylformylglycinamidine synthase subunit PurL [Alicyclobacillus contaminans]|uniref:phosphoribosylformylglycinamidine synthase subunit PurL n=1 Tax=Alicyclobacillus contaminans TaxID=392016 RepID=UPI00041793B8|nr:phosphoribosylformylglycinamidine synthase subunit PurL [Alicyclobacillus contaminans]
MVEPKAEQIRNERLYRGMGLTDAEYDCIVAQLGRLPNWVETGLFSVLWSEHCSYKSSRRYLKRFPTNGPQVLQGPGENAGVVDFGDGIGIAFKMESHNHPSAIEPYQGAATGVGGILRDIFTMGARPIAFLNSLRFGTLDEAHTRYLFANVVAGIGGYGNCVGIPTVAGEAVFDEVYRDNPLVNAMCVGVLPADGMVRGTASGVGNPVFVVGARTGRDGIHGATFASAEDPHEKERSAVQVGDPFFGKLLMEACLELIATGAVVGIQDMGAAGLTSSSAEMASRADGGIELYLDAVPVREDGMTPYEMMLSESQERMLVVMERGKEAVAEAIFAKWGLPIANIGRVTDDGRLRLWFRGECVADVPVSLLVDEAPVYDRPVAAPAALPGREVALPETFPAPETALRELLGHPSVADKRWIYRQYDTTVKAATRVGPGGDAAVLRVPGTNRLLALCCDGNGRYVYLNPRKGGAMAVAEAARNIVCAGGQPLAITNCLNFGNPEKPEIMYQFAEATAGMSEACLALNTPVVSGNVSFYNESRSADIHPTPVIGMVGVIEDERYVTPNAFQQADHAVVLLGVEDDSLDGSLYWKTLAGQPAGDAPAFDLAAEVNLQNLVHRLIREGRVVSAHDVSDGGLAVTLAELCIGGGMGVVVEAPAGAADLSASQASLRAAGWLFSEAPSRICLEVRPTDVAEVLAAAAEAGVPARQIGWTGGSRLVVRTTCEDWVNVPVAELAQVYQDALPNRMQVPVTPGA